MLTLLSIFAWVIAIVAWLTLLAPLGSTRVAHSSSDPIQTHWERDAAASLPQVADKWRPRASWGGTGRTEL